MFDAQGQGDSRNIRAYHQMPCGITIQHHSSYKTEVTGNPEDRQYSGITLTVTLYHLYALNSAYTVPRY